MIVTFLGTSCMIPTKERNHPGIFVKYQHYGLLFDCGEGIQRQLKISGTKITDVTHLFITHWHGDHVLGIPGLIQSLGSSEYSGKLKIFGPKGTEEFMQNMFKAFVFDNKVELEIFDITQQGMFLEEKEFFVEAYDLDHGIRTIGFRLVEKDKRRIKIPFIKKVGIPEGPLLGQLQKGEDIMFNGKKISVEDATYIVPGKIISFISDTQLCKGCMTLAKDADLLISEASYESGLEDKAEQYKHMTAKHAADVASQSNAKRLVLTHFSARYKTTEKILEEAQTIFPETICATDFTKIKV